MSILQRIAALPAPVRHGTAAFFAGFLGVIISAILQAKGVTNVMWWPDTLREALDWGAVSAVSVPSVLAATNLTDAYGVGKAKVEDLSEELDQSPAPLDTTNHEAAAEPFGNDETPEGIDLDEVSSLER